MWGRITGKSADKAVPSRRKEGSTLSDRKGPPSKSSRSDDHDRGFYPGAVAPSVASSYATAQTDMRDERVSMTALMRSTSLAERQHKSKSSRDEKGDDGAEVKRSPQQQQQQRSISKSTKGHRRDRSRSADRTSSTKQARQQRRGTDPGSARVLEDSKRISRAGEHFPSSSFGAQIGESGFTQFPGQYDAGIPGTAWVQPQLPSHVPEIFPGQFPSGTTRPYRPPLAISEGGPGLASEYYGDEGESVAHQPGVRPNAPTLIIGAEPHLMAASSVAAPPIEPSATGQVGAAASFYSEASFGSPKIPSKALSGPSSGSFVPPGPTTLVKPQQSSSAMPALGTAVAYVPGSHSSQLASQHQAAQYHHYEKQPSSSGDLPGGPSSSQRPSSYTLQTSSTKPPRPGMPLPHSSSNTPLYLAGAAGLVAATPHENYQQTTHDSYSGQQYKVNSSTLQQSRPKGSMAKLIDFFVDPDGVAQFEEYTEYIGVCRYCFAPGSSPRDAPRKHCYRRRSNERFGSSTRIDKESRYSSSGSEHHRKGHRSWIAAGLAGAGLSHAVKGLNDKRRDFDDRYSIRTGRPIHGSVAPFEVHRGSSPWDRRSRSTSHGVVSKASGSPNRSRSREEVSSTIQHGDTSPMKEFNSEFGSTSRQRSRSKSGAYERRTSFVQTTAGAMMGSIIADSVSKSRKRKSSPPKTAIVQSKHRSRAGSLDSDSSSRRRSRRSRHSSQSGPGLFGRLFNLPSGKKKTIKPKRREKNDGFFNFGNASLSSTSSSSSSNSALIFGADRRSYRSRRSGPFPPRIKSDSDAKAALIGLGTAAAALAAVQRGHKDSSGWQSGLIAVKQARPKRLVSGRKEDDKQKYRLTDEDDLWESASEEDVSSADSALAFGLPRQKSQEFLSDSSGTSKWGWRWGSRKKKRAPSTKTPGHQSLELGVVAGAVAQTAILSIDRDRERHSSSPDNESGSRRPPMQHVYPLATTSGDYDVTRYGLVGAGTQPLVTARPDPIPLQQPQPMTPVSNAVFTTQGHYDHSYSAPAELPVFSQQFKVPGGFPSDVLGKEKDKEDRKYERTRVIEGRRRNSSPTPHVFSIEPKSTKRFSLREDVSQVRFDFTQEQQERHDRDESRDKESRERRRLESERHEATEQAELDRAERKRRKPRVDKDIDPSKKESRNIEDVHHRFAGLQHEEAHGAGSSNVSSNGIELAMKRESESSTSIAGAAIDVAIIEENNSESDMRLARRKGERREEGRRMRQEARDIDEQKIDHESTYDHVHEKAGDLSKSELDSDGLARITKRAAEIVRRSPSPVHENYATYFAPTEILAKEPRGKERAFSPSADDGILVEQHSNLVTIEPKGKRSTSPFSFPGDESLVIDTRCMNFPWLVPNLNLVRPTPQPSPNLRAIKSNGLDLEETSTFQEVSPLPDSSEEAAGNNQTHEFKTTILQEPRERFIISEPAISEIVKYEVPMVIGLATMVANSESPVVKTGRDQMPGEFNEDLDFAATVAAGLEDSGFDPAIVFDDPTFRRRDTPPGSEEADSFRHPPVQNTVQLVMESLGIECASPAVNFVEEEENPPTPKERGNASSMESDQNGNVVGFDSELSKKERKKRGKAVKRSSNGHGATGKPSNVQDELKLDPDDAELENIKNLAKQPAQDEDWFSTTKRPRNSKKQDSGRFVPRQPKSPDLREDVFFDATETTRSPAGILLFRENQENAGDDPLPEAEDEFVSPKRVFEPVPSSLRNEDDLYDSPGEYDPSVAITQPVSNDLSEAKRSKKKKGSTGFDDPASVGLVCAKLDQTQMNGQEKEDRQDGPFGESGELVDDSREKWQEEEAGMEATKDYFKEPKRKHKKKKDRKSISNESDSHTVATTSAADVFHADEDVVRRKGYDLRGKESKRRSRDSSNFVPPSSVDLTPIDDDEAESGRHRSKGKERRSSRKNSEILNNSGRTTQDLLKKMDAKRDHLPLERDLEKHNAELKTSHEEQESPVSFLGVRQETKPPDIERDQHNVGDELSVLTTTSSAEPRGVALVPAVSEREVTEDDVDSPFRRLDPAFSTPKATRRRLTMLQSESGHPASPPVLSPTAVPLVFRRPLTAGRSHPASPIPSSMNTPRQRPGHRHHSTEFKSNEFRPLFLVERHQSKPEIDPNEILPSLPSSHTTSRASSVHENDSLTLIPPQTPKSGFRGAPLSIDLARDHENDAFNSQEATPTVAPFRAQREQALLDESRHEALSRELKWSQHHSGELQRRDLEDRPESSSITVTDPNITPADTISKPYNSSFNSRVEISSEKSLSRSTILEDQAGFLPNQLKDLGNTRALIAGWGMRPEEHGITTDMTKNDLALAIDETVQQATEPVEEVDVFVTAKKGKKRDKKQRRGAQTTSEPGASVTSSNEVLPPIAQERRKLELQDTQDALGTLFEDPKLKTKKGKNVKKARDPSLTEFEDQSQKLSNAARQDLKQNPQSPKLEARVAYTSAETGSLAKGITTAEATGVMVSAALSEEALERCVDWEVTGLPDQDAWDGVSSKLKKSKRNDSATTGVPHYQNLSPPPPPTEDKIGELPRDETKRGALIVPETEVAGDVNSLKTGFTVPSRVESVDNLTADIHQEGSPELVYEFISASPVQQTLEFTKDTSEALIPTLQPREVEDAENARFSFYKGVTNDTTNTRVATLTTPEGAEVISLRELKNGTKKSVSSTPTDPLTENLTEPNETALQDNFTDSAGDFSSIIEAELNIPPRAVALPDDGDDDDLQAELDVSPEAVALPDDDDLEFRLDVSSEVVDDGGVYLEVEHPFQPETVALPGDDDLEAGLDVQPEEVALPEDDDDALEVELNVPPETVALTEDDLIALTDDNPEAMPLPDDDDDDDEPLKAELDVQPEAVPLPNNNDDVLEVELDDPPEAIALQEDDDLEVELDIQPEIIPLPNMDDGNDVEDELDVQPKGVTLPDELDVLPEADLDVQPQAVHLPDDDDLDAGLDVPPEAEIGFLPEVVALPDEDDLEFELDVPSEAEMDFLPEAVALPADDDFEADVPPEAEMKFLPETVALPDDDDLEFEVDVPSETELDVQPKDVALLDELDVSSEVELDVHPEAVALPDDDDNDALEAELDVPPEAVALPDDDDLVLIDVDEDRDISVYYAVSDQIATSVNGAEDYQVTKKGQKSKKGRQSQYSTPAILQPVEYISWAEKPRIDEPLQPQEPLAVSGWVSTTKNKGKKSKRSRNQVLDETGINEPRPEDRPSTEKNILIEVPEERVEPLLDSAPGSEHVQPADLGTNTQTSSKKKKGKKGKKHSQQEPILDLYPAPLLTLEAASEQIQAADEWALPVDGVVKNDEKEKVQLLDDVPTLNSLPNYFSTTNDLRVFERSGEVLPVQEVASKSISQNLQETMSTPQIGSVDEKRVDHGGTMLYKGKGKSERSSSLTEQSILSQYKYEGLGTVAVAEAVETSQSEAQVNPQIRNDERPTTNTNDNTNARFTKPAASKEPDEEIPKDDPTDEWAYPAATEKGYKKKKMSRVVDTTENVLPAAKETTTRSLLAAASSTGPTFDTLELTSKTPTPTKDKQITEGIITYDHLGSVILSTLKTLYPSSNERVEEETVVPPMRRKIVDIPKPKDSITTDPLSIETTDDEWATLTTIRNGKGNKKSTKPEHVVKPESVPAVIQEVGKTSESTNSTDVAQTGEVTQSSFEVSQVGLGETDDLWTVPLQAGSPKHVELDIPKPKGKKKNKRKSHANPPNDHQREKGAQDTLEKTLSRSSTGYEKLLENIPMIVSESLNADAETPKAQQSDSTALALPSLFLESSYHPSEDDQSFHDMSLSGLPDDSGDDFFDTKEEHSTAPSVIIEPNQEAEFTVEPAAHSGLLALLDYDRKQNSSLLPDTFPEPNDKQENSSTLPDAVVNETEPSSEITALSKEPAMSAQSALDHDDILETTSIPPKLKKGKKKGKRNSTLSWDDRINHTAVDSAPLSNANCEQDRLQNNEVTMEWDKITAENNIQMLDVAAKADEGNTEQSKVKQRKSGKKKNKRPGSFWEEEPDAAENQAGSAGGLILEPPMKYLPPQVAPEEQLVMSKPTPEDATSELVTEKPRSTGQDGSDKKFVQSKKVKKKGRKAQVFAQDNGTDTPDTRTQAEPSQDDYNRMPTQFEDTNGPSVQLAPGQHEPEKDPLTSDQKPKKRNNRASAAAESLETGPLESQVPETPDLSITDSENDCVPAEDVNSAFNKNLQPGPNTDTAAPLDEIAEPTVEVDSGAIWTLVASEPKAMEGSSRAHAFGTAETNNHEQDQEKQKAQVAFPATGLPEALSMIRNQGTEVIPLVQEPNDSSTGIIGTRKAGSVTNQQMSEFSGYNMRKSKKEKKKTKKSQAFHLIDGEPESVTAPRPEGKATIAQDMSLADENRDLTKGNETDAQAFKETPIAEADTLEASFVVNIIEDAATRIEGPCHMPEEWLNASTEHSLTEQTNNTEPSVLWEAFLTQEDNKQAELLSSAAPGATAADHGAIANQDTESFIIESTNNREEAKKALPSTLVNEPFGEVPEFIDEQILGDGFLQRERVEHTQATPSTPSEPAEQQDASIESILSRKKGKKGKKIKAEDALAASNGDRTVGLAESQILIMDVENKQTLISQFEKDRPSANGSEVIEAPSDDNFVESATKRKARKEKKGKSQPIGWTQDEPSPLPEDLGHSIKDASLAKFGEPEVLSPTIKIMIDPTIHEDPDPSDFRDIPVDLEDDQSGVNTILSIHEMPQHLTEYGPETSMRGQKPQRSRESVDRGIKIAEEEYSEQSILTRGENLSADEQLKTTHYHDDTSHLTFTTDMLLENAVQYEKSLPAEQEDTWHAPVGKKSKTSGEKRIILSDRTDEPFIPAGFPIAPLHAHDHKVFSSNVDMVMEDPTSVSPNEVPEQRKKEDDMVRPATPEGSGVVSASRKGRKSKKGKKSSKQASGLASDTHTGEACVDLLHVHGGDDSNAITESFDHAIPANHPSLNWTLGENPSLSKDARDAKKAAGVVGTGIALFETLKQSDSGPGNKENMKKKGGKISDWEGEKPEALGFTQETQSQLPNPMAVNRRPNDEQAGDRGTNHVNRDSAVHFADSPFLAEGALPPYNPRDSGYQATEVDSFHALNDVDGALIGTRPISRTGSSRGSLNISIEVEPGYDISILATEDRHSGDERSGSQASYDVYDKESQLLQGSGYTTPVRQRGRQPFSPVDSTTKHRSAPVFNSSPFTRNISAQSSGRNETDSFMEEDVGRHKPISLFGGPFGVNSDLETVRSPPRTLLGVGGIPKPPLMTITEQTPHEPTVQKGAQSMSDAEQSPHASKLLRRRPGTPRGISAHPMRSPVPEHDDRPRKLGHISTDDMIARLPWPAVDDDSHSVELERSVNSSDHGREHRSEASNAERRSFSGASIESCESISAIIRLQETPKPSTPPLRRVNRSVSSSDLRRASREHASRGAKTAESENASRPSSSTCEPLNDKGKGRIIRMVDVYEGWGDVHDSPRSPTRPPSMRRKQSLQILDLETRLDQLVSENRLLQDAKSRAERGLEGANHHHNQGYQALKDAVRTRDLYLRQKDSELEDLRGILDGLQGEVSRLSKVNEHLESARDVGRDDELEQRYKNLEAEHSQTRQQWEMSTRELAEMRGKHVSLAGGMEELIAREVALAVGSKDVELRQLRSELDLAKQEVRSLQRQILASRNSDEVLVTHDENYFDGKCQQLCQHVQQWVLRFSKFSDMKVCRSIAVIEDEKITDRFENAILDGSDVDDYLADRIKRRDVFMSVVMTMVWEYVFTRYLFGMDREQRQKLKALEKTLSEIGRPAAVNKWRATTLSMLSRRDAFIDQRAADTEAVVQEIYHTLSLLLPPPPNLINQIQESLLKVMQLAVDLSIEMRTQRAEYIMLPPLQPEYNTNGDLERKVLFNAELMNERSGTGASNNEVHGSEAVVRMVLFPLVVKRGDDEGVGDEEIVVCPAQVLVAREDEAEGRRARGAGEEPGATRSMTSIAPSAF